MSVLNAVGSNNRDREWRWGLGTASLLTVAIIWQGLAIQLHSLLLPTFTSTVAAGVRLAPSRELWAALWISNQAAALGFLSAAFVGSVRRHHRWRRDGMVAPRRKSSGSLPPDLSGRA